MPLRRILALALWSLAAACTTTKQMYEGPRLPPESEATVSGRTGPFSISGQVVQSTVYITAVDGRSALLLSEILNVNPYPLSVFVLPGSHEFSVRWDIGYRPSVDGRVRIDAEPGKRYVIAGRLAKPYGIPLHFPGPRNWEIEFYVEPELMEKR